MTQTPPGPQETLKTNHNIRVVTLVTGEKVLCLFGEVRQEGEVVGYYSFSSSSYCYVVVVVVVVVVIFSLLLRCHYK